MKPLVSLALSCVLTISVAGCESHPDPGKAQEFTEYMRATDIGALDKRGVRQGYTDEALLKEGMWACERFEEDGVFDLYSRRIVSPYYIYGMTREEQIVFYSSLFRGASAWLCPEYADQVSTLLDG